MYDKSMEPFGPEAEMIETSTRSAAIVLVGTLLAVGCATNGDIESLREEQQAALEEQQAALEAERADRIAADERLASDLAQLRSDLTALRDEFDAKIAAVEEGLQFAFPIHFEFDEAMVREGDLVALDRFADVINSHYPGTLVTVEGFADPAGPAAYNKSLSQRRAEAVRSHLMDVGIQAQVRAVGYGEERPVVDGAVKDDPGAELNRRVVFVVESPEGSMRSMSDEGTTP